MRHGLNNNVRSRHGAIQLLNTPLGNPHRQPRFGTVAFLIAGVFTLLLKKGYGRPGIIDRLSLR